MSQLKDWFNGKQDREFRQPQRPGYILPRMALTIADPKHGEALQYSCHQYVAEGIRQNMDKLEPTDRIIHFGRAGIVFHTIMVRGDDVLLDRAITKEYQGYDPEAGVYRTTRGGEEIMHEITFGDFVDQYLSKIDLAAPDADETPQAAEGQSAPPAGGKRTP